MEFTESPTQPLHAVSIIQNIEWDSGHRVHGHEGKCRFLHGHRYKAEIEVERIGLDPLGMVMDFSDVKKLIKDWIDTNWDHNFLGHPDDPLVKLWSFVNRTEWPKGEEDMHRIMRHVAQDVLSDRPPYVMRNGNPTAENIASELLAISQSLLGGDLSSIQVVSVTVWETPNCRAVAIPGE